VSKTIEDNFDSGTLHRLIALKDKQKGKKLRIRTGTYSVQMILDNVQKQFDIPDFDGRHYHCTFCNEASGSKICDGCAEEYRRS